MNVLAQTIEDVPVGVAIGDGPAALGAIVEPGCAAAIWRREPPAAVLAWLDGLDPEVLPQGRVILRPKAVAQAVSRLCDASGLPVGETRDWLEADITALAERFTEITGAEYLRMRLSVVNNNSCRKFHVDGIFVRLVCTYRGSGTQYGISQNGADPARVFNVQTGSPIMLRGTRWPEEPPSGLLHRSPPIEGTGESRLLLVLDPVIDPEEEE